MISRRTFVGGLLSVSTFGLAGCTSDGSEPEGGDTTTDTDGSADSSSQNDEADGSGQSDGSDSSDGSDLYTDFQAAVVDSGIEVIDGNYDSDEALVELSYIPQSGNENAIADEIGTISGTFFRHVDDGLDATRLECRMFNAEETLIADWYALVEWYEEFKSEEISADELSVRIIETINQA